MARRAQPQAQPDAPVVPAASLNPGRDRNFFYQQLEFSLETKVKARMNGRESSIPFALWFKEYLVVNTKENYQKYLKYVRFDDVGETILIKHLGEEFILPKFEDQEEIIRLNHADRHHPFRVTIQMIERKHCWPGMYRQLEACLSKCDSCVRYANKSSS